MYSIVLGLTLVCCLHLTTSLDNGLALTPPMGWLSWERFRCNTDCVNDPDNCIGEKLFMKMADLMVSEGYKDAGYEYVNIDDCWLAKERTASGQLAPDPDRFPSGMKALADYIHARGLKLGIYEDFGTKTCGGFPGSEYYLQMDAQTFADWGVDFLKLDGCYSDPKQYSDGYPPVAFFLNKTGRSILLSCEYPLYEQGHGIKINYTRVREACNVCRNGHDIQDSWASASSIIELYRTNLYNFAEVAGPGFYNDPDEPNYPQLASSCNLGRNFLDIDDGWPSVQAIIEYYALNLLDFASLAQPGYYNDPDQPNYPLIAKWCNIWRNYGDIQDSWASLSSIITFYGNDHSGFAEVAGPGNFNDPDMLIIGNYGLSYDQQRVQMAMWSLMASPLIMSVDLRTIRPESKELLQNKGAISINQDRLGVQGKCISKAGNIEIWTKPILPKGSFAFTFLNMGDGGMPSKVSMKLSDLGMTSANGYTVAEVFTGQIIGKLLPGSTVNATVNPSGVFFGKAQVL